MKIYITILPFLFFLINFNVLGQSNSKPEVGPENGHLIIVGGGKLSDDILLKFIELSGGPEAKIILVPTAGGGKEYSDDAGDYFRSKGAKNVVVLHTIDSTEADSEEFSEPLKEAGGVWFTGGRQWRLVDSYKNTKTEKAFQEVLDRGGVIGGSSAGATIQGSYLARGDTQNNQIMMGDHEEGFGYLRNVAIDQHVLARNRQFDLFTILQKRPELLGFGIDENTAMIVKGDEVEVIGSSYVLVYDGNFWSREGWQSKQLPSKQNLFYFLRSGDKYNLKERSIIKQ